LVRWPSIRKTDEVRIEDGHFLSVDGRKLLINAMQLSTA
jgi:hypothetical protein